MEQLNLQNKFIENLIKDSKKFPYGKPKELRRKWEDLPQEEQEQWNLLATYPEMQIYKMAYDAFQRKQSHGVPEDVYRRFFETMLTPDEMKIWEDCFKHFVEAHAQISRKGMEKKFHK